MTTNQYKTLASIAAARLLVGDCWGVIRADMEAAQGAPFSKDEWQKIRFLAALDAAFESTPKPTQPAPSDPNKPKTVIRIHADSSGNFHVSEEKL